MPLAQGTTVDGVLVPLRVDASGIVQISIPGGIPTVPTGAIMPYGASVAPTGYLLCDSASYLRSDYAALFAVIGTAFGAADGTHFNVPDLRGRTIVGTGTGTGGGISSNGQPTGGVALIARALADYAGEETHQLLEGEVPSHNHSVTANTHTHFVNDPGHDHLQQRNTSTAGSETGIVTAPDTSSSNPGGMGPLTEIASTGVYLNPTVVGINETTIGSDNVHNNLQPLVALAYIIKI